MSADDQERVDEELFDSDGDLTTYKGSPFTGVGFDPFPDGEGIEYETEYKDGLPNGLARKWYSLGRLAFEVECKNGLTHGKETYWYENGNMKSESFFEYGIKTSSRSWSESGELIEEFSIDVGSTNYKLLQERRKEEP
ncbi:toxin-antitoxin system YwqK family antitoxin [Hahella ganghwensis]|uniref:toxin-antitoxin system YwqK family antitoxin n=1 Tax=Hahella ganghwensis TaxID=286420 RepID=UPI00035DF194|nr:hypothetical protein [Hahella ganghwensis]